MPTCSDRQLVQSQLEQGFSTRIGVARAIRPFSGDPAPQNLVDYINRELFPAVKAGREKLNEVYRNVADQAPSANPLNYLFSSSVVAADPTTGRLRLNQAIQNTATTIRISETNAKLVSSFAWLDVMSGSATTPLGVVTLADSSDPGRFVRFDLTAMVDQGAYWDLAVTPTESSHPNPFVEGESVTIGFIPGVAAGGISINSTVGGVGLRAASAGTQLLTSGTLSFANSNSITFGLSNSSVLTASYLPRIGLLSHVGGNLVPNVTRIDLSDASGVSWSLSTAVGYALIRATVAAQTSLSFSNGSGVTFGIAGSTLTASVNDQSLGLVSHIAGNSVSNVTRLAFSNASNVTWSLSTAAGAVTVIASVAAGGGGGETKTLSLVTYANSQASSLTNATDSSFSGNPWNLQLLDTASNTNFSRANVFFRLSSGSLLGVAAMVFGDSANFFNSPELIFSNSNGLSWTMTTTTHAAFGRAALISGDYAAPRAVSAGTQQMTVGTLVFANSNNISFGLSGSSQLTAQPFFNVGFSSGAVTTTNNVTHLSFSNANNVGWGLSTNASGATLRAAASFNLSAGTGTAAVSQLSFNNANGITWILTNGGSTVEASYARELGLVSHVGGNSVASVTRLAFSNASNVTFSLSTAAGAATLLASVAAAAGGGVAIGDGTGTVTSGTMLFSNEAGLGGAAGSVNTQNVRFALTGQSLGATALIGIEAGNASTTFNPANITGFKFINSNSITFGTQSTSLAQGRVVLITASVDNAPTVSFWNNVAGWDDLPSLTISGAASSFRVFPLQDNGPFVGNMTVNTLGMMFTGSGFSTTQCSASWAFTLRGALYTLANSTQLSLVNSFSTTLSSAGGNSTNSVSRNNLFAGFRWVTVHSSLWSSQPVLSNGVHYWMAANMSIAGASCAIQEQRLQRNDNAFFEGIMGSSNSVVSLGRGVVPFLGFISTGAPPASIGTAAMLTGNANNPMYRPIVQFLNIANPAGT